VWLETQCNRGRQIFVAFKVAEVCNLKCGYCYFFEKADDSYKSAPAYMTEETAIAAARFLAQGAVDAGIPTVTIALHGGEPLMMGKARLARICQILRDEITPHARLRLGIQTNGVLLDREWISLLQSNDCSIGISLDGPKALHDAARPDKRGRGSYDRVVAALRLLQQAHANGEISEFGVLSVIDPKLTAEQSYALFVDDLGIKSIFFRQPSMTWDEADPATIQSVNTFLRDIFRIWVERNDSAVEIRSNVETLHPFLHDNAVAHRIDHLVDLVQAISIRSNGDVCVDDSLPALTMRYRDTGYNVRTDSLAQFYASDIWPEIQASLTDKKSDCADCKWFGICGGGPIANRYSDAQRFQNRSVYCEGYRGLFEDAYSYVGPAIGDVVIKDRLNLAAERLKRVSPATGALKPFDPPVSISA